MFKALGMDEMMDVNGGSWQAAVFAAGMGAMTGGNPYVMLASYEAITTIEKGEPLSKPETEKWLEYGANEVYAD